MSNLNILHVEDDAADAIIIKESLGKTNSGSRNLRIQRVETMKDAIREIYCNEYSAILLDLNLSDIRGLDNVRCIRAENKELPIIVLTGVDNAQWAEEVLEAGAQEYIVKGHCNGEILQRVIHSSIYRKNIENKLYKQANFDELTGLPNKTFFRDVLTTHLQRAKRWDRQEAALFVDIADFKNINRTFGEDVGDKLLIQVARRLKDNLRDSDMIARYDGDTFAIHLDKRDDENIKAHCMFLANKIKEFLSQPFEIDNRGVKIDVNIVMSIYPDAGDNFISMIENTEVAMHFLQVNHKTNICFAKNLHKRLTPEKETFAGNRKTIMH